MIVLQVMLPPHYRKLTRCFLMSVRSSGVSDDTTVNRLYFACHHTTKAVLYNRGHDPKLTKG